MVPVAEMSNSLARLSIHAIDYPSDRLSLSLARARARSLVDREGRAQRDSGSEYIPVSTAPAAAATRRKEKENL